MKLFLGTSGFGYREWKGKFYPKELPPGEMLAYYARRMNATEVNNTFYRLPAPAVVRGWAAETPAAFSFSFKAPGLITHRLRLRDAQPPLRRFLDVVAAAGPKLGVLNFQLPPNLALDLPRLEEFLELLPAGRRYAVEFRHASWFSAPVYRALERRGVALCLNDDDVEGSPLVETAAFGMLKLRRTAYTQAALRGLSRRVRGLGWRQAYVFFKHEPRATGPALAERFRALW